MSTPIIATAVEQTAKSWRAEAAKRRGISKSDPVADTLEYCAGEISARVGAVLEDAKFETVEERAKRERVTPQTVRIWIRSGQLPAHDGPRGYRIPVSAERERKAG